MDGDREFDIVLFGCTGFVGGLTADYLSRRAPGSCRIALAGRDRAKLDDIAGRLKVDVGTDVGVVVADVTDPGALASLAARTVVLVTTVGPYTEYGLEVVRACVDAGTDYLDLAGEPLFVRDSIAKYHGPATRSGSRIVHSSGFDSVPSDLSVKILSEFARESGDGGLTDTTLVVRGIRGGFSGGTAASGLAHGRAMASSRGARAAARDPYTLSHCRTAEPELGPQPDGRIVPLAAVAPDLRGWAGGFFMGFHNTRIVRRSNTLTDWSYGRRFSYSEVMACPGGPASIVPSAVMAAGIRSMYSSVRLLGAVPESMTDAVMPRRGSGPGAASRSKGYFDFQTYATTSSGARYRTDFAMDGDPGYAATAVILGESALAMACDRDRLGQSGVVTPAVAMGDVLPQRLRAAGARIKITRLD
ncbi:saccharopine dehydrogenase NADP-binding domain-containing protein [Gordonia malaquae]|uniref:saccharopine dehydrogenase family protein n=1 Tax=Gordonia malaquae TaxID=410332 RepID=UPI0030C79061